MLPQEQFNFPLLIEEIDPQKPQCFFSAMVQFLEGKIDHSCSSKLPSPMSSFCENCGNCDRVYFYCSLERCREVPASDFDSLGALKHHSFHLPQGNHLVIFSSKEEARRSPWANAPYTYLRDYAVADSTTGEMLIRFYFDTTLNSFEILFNGITPGKIISDNIVIDYKSTLDRFSKAASVGAIGHELDAFYKGTKLIPWKDPLSKSLVNLYLHILKKNGALSPTQEMLNLMNVGSLLHQAVQRSDLYLIIKLLELGADIDVRDKNEVSPYELAMRMSDLSVQVLLQLAKFQQHMVHSHQVKNNNEILSAWSFMMDILPKLNNQSIVLRRYGISILNSILTKCENVLAENRLKMQSITGHLQSDIDRDLKQEIESRSKPQAPSLSVAESSVVPQLSVVSPSEDPALIQMKKLERILVACFLEKLHISTGVSTVTEPKSLADVYQECEAAIVAGSKHPNFDLNRPAIFSLSNADKYRSNPYLFMLGEANLPQGNGRIQEVDKKQGQEIKYFKINLIFIATALGDLKLLKLLVENGARVNVNYGKKSSPLYMLVMNVACGDNQAMLRYLLENNGLFTHDLIRIAVRNRLKNSLKILCEFGARFIHNTYMVGEQEKTVYPSLGYKFDFFEDDLGFAIEGCDYEMVRILSRDLSVDVNSCPIGTTISPLSRIAQTWRPKKREDLSQDQLSILELLKQDGSNPSALNVPKDINRNPLYSADTFHNHSHGIKTRDSRLDDLERVNPLLEAIKYDNHVIFEIFLEFPRLKLETPLTERMVTLLMCIPGSKDASLFFKKLLEKKVDVHFRDSEKRTALHITAAAASLLPDNGWEDTVEIIKSLSQAGINLHARNIHNLTALMLAGAGSCRSEIIAEFLYQEWKLLFNKGFEDSKELDADCRYFSRILANTMLENKGTYELGQFRGLYFHTMKLPRVAFKHQPNFEEIFKKYSDPMIGFEGDFYQLLENIFKRKVFENQFKDKTLTSKDILEYFWQQLPIKKEFDKRQALKQRLKENEEIGDCIQRLSWLPKKMTELPHRLILSEINEVINEIEKVIAHINGMCLDDFDNPKFNKRQEKRCKTVRRIHYGHDGSDGETKVEGLVSLSSDAVSLYKQIQKTVKEFFLSYTGNPNFMFQESMPAEYLESLKTVMNLNPKRHNKSSHVYIYFLLRNGNIDRAKVLLAELDKMRALADSQCEAFRNILEKLRQYLDKCQKLREEASRDNDKRNEKCASNRKENAVNDDKKSQKDEPKKGPDQILADNSTQIKELKQANDQSKKPEKDPAKSAEVVRATTLTASQTRVWAPKPVRPQLSDIKPSLRQYLPQYNVEMNGGTFYESYERPKRPKQMTLGDHQIHTRLNVVEHQKKLRHLLARELKADSKANHFIIQNNALLLAMALLMENAKTLKGSNQVFDANLARDFRNGIFHSWKFLPDCGVDIKLLSERNALLREMTQRLLAMIKENYGHQSQQGFSREAALAKMNFPLFTQLCRAEIEAPNYKDCRKELAVCDQHRIIYVIEQKENYDLTEMQLAQEFSTSQVSTYMRHIEKNKVQWKEEMSSEELDLLRRQYSDDIVLGQKIRHSS